MVMCVILCFNVIVTSSRVPFKWTHFLKFLHKISMPLVCISYVLHASTKIQFFILSYEK